MNASEVEVMQRRASETVTIRRVTRAMDKGVSEVQRLREENADLQRRISIVEGDRDIWRQRCMNLEGLARVRLQMREEADVV